MAFTTVTVTADYDLANGIDPTGKVSFTPTEAMVNGHTIVEAPVSITLNVDGGLTTGLAANTDPATAPADTSYLVEEEINGVSRSYYVQIPHDQGTTIDLSSLPAALVPAPVTVPELDEAPPLVVTYPPAGTNVTVDGVHVDTYAVDSTPVGVGDLAGVSQVNAPVNGVLTATSVTSPGTAGALVTGWQVLTPAFVPPALTNSSGRYGFPVSPGATSTSNTLTNGTLRVAPWIVPFATSIDRIGAECTATGDAGSKLRIAIYSDNGHCYPGALLLDAGQIAGDTATVQDLTVSQTLPAGLYWIGGAVQAVTTTQPTFRISNNVHSPVPLITTNSTPSAGATTVGYAQTSVTGAAPSNFSTSITATGSVPRIHVRYT